MPPRSTPARYSFSRSTRPALIVLPKPTSSAIAAAFDYYISTETQPIANTAKDTGSAAVMGLGDVAAWVFALLALF